MSCKYSIIIPIYNIEEYLSRCLDSLSKQTFKDFEVICINDGSTDNSQEIVDMYVKKDMRFKSFYKENGGSADARNYGIKEANGKYIIFVDGDDYVSNELLDCIDRESDKYDIVVYGYQLANYNGDVKDFIPDFEENKAYSLDSDASLLNKLDNCPWDKCYRRELFKGIKFPMGSLFQDFGTTYRIVDIANSVGFIKKILIYYSFSRYGNVTSDVSFKILDIFEMCKVNIEYFKKVNKFERFYDELALLCWREIVDCMHKLPRCGDLEFASSYIDQAFDFMTFYFNKKKRAKVAISLVDYIYEYRWLCKLYMKIKLR